MTIRYASRISTGLSLATAALVGGQAYVAGHRPLPHFPDLDPSTQMGPEDGQPLRIAALGDSTCTGPGLLDPEDIWLRKALRPLDGHRITLTSFADGGAKIADMRRRQLRPALRSRPDIAVIACGSNDALRMVPHALAISDLDVVVDALAASGAAVLLMGVGDLGTIPRIPAPLAQLATARSAVMDRHQRTLATGNPAVVKAPLRELATEAFRIRSDLFTPDLFHPNARGQAVWADAVGPTLHRLIATTSERKDTCAD